MTTKFKAGISLRERKLAVEKHGENHGLTTWMYLPDPNNEQEMINVVKNHFVFLGSPDRTIKQVPKQAELCNSFDHENGKALATTFLTAFCPSYRAILTS